VSLSAQLPLLLLPSGNLFVSREDIIKTTGKVIRDLSHGLFTVELDNGHQITAHRSGRLRKYMIKILPGDTVTIELSPYDLKKGRITFRN
jgi:translation initiation factor IF-1